MQVVVCLTSFNRTDCARISMEIIKLNWPRKWPVVHACADASYTRYIEDILVMREPKPLTRGAHDLLVASIKTAVTKLKADYVIHLEADTWIFDQNVIVRYLERLEKSPHAVVAASSWSTDRVPEWSRSDDIRRRLRARLALWLRRCGSRYGIRDRKSLSTQFFIAKSTPAMLDVIRSLHPGDRDILEKRLYEGVIQRFGRRAVLGMDEREPVHPGFRDVCEPLSLVCHHWPSAADAPRHDAFDRLRGKKEWLQAANLRTHGPHMKRLLSDTDLSYYNGDAKRTG
ncbi:hypothetical protein [Paraburkholderia hospita]|uniref:hypothetical protein n=1 Tax=Paraburkholderia hospita TaxID=169430 RepID=UPI000DEFC016|nr:hypothetical protein [Paraburkholderia hospita]AXF01098.1 hypothetical protein CUJ88_21670 [Paraburkholderia hospita]